MQKVFGYDQFREYQLEIMQHVLSGKDALVIMPTGGGKSMCYQLPALVSKGLTLVISPLIALMSDQVANLRANNVPASFINSTLTNQEKKKVFLDLEKGITKLLYISPEKAVIQRFIQYIRNKKIDLIAIDEAHCVSIWGNDFRPVYAQLTELTSTLSKTPMMALTATADRATQLDICEKLRLRNPRIFLSSFERKNIQIQVRPAQGRMQQIQSFLREHKGQAGIIYCLSRKSTEEVAEKLRGFGYRAAHYHAEISSEDRKRIQEAFQKDELQIVCATIAFGMGIDKSNVRWIIHYNLPKNIESYYQEIGRAGRDGAMAQAILFYNFHDINVFRRFIDDSEASIEFRNVQHQKLDRIWEFTQASSCRTNLILNYFGEYRNTDCMHCDNCIRPPKGFDGTFYTQQALAVCQQGDQKLNLGLIADILRASGRKEIYDRGLQRLNNYGAGRDISRLDWLHYLTQMVNQGVMMIDYTDHSHLKFTSLSLDILEGRKKVKLTRPVNFKAPIVQDKSPGKNESFNENLFKLLKDWRRDQAAKEKMPAYIILNDRVLKEIAKERPATLLDLINISGIGEYKLEKYGREIIKIIQEYIQKQDILKNVKGQSKLQTLKLFQEGYDPDKIASERQLKTATVYDHLIELYSKGENIDLHPLISKRILHEVTEGWRLAKNINNAATVAEFILTPIPLNKIKVALAIINKENRGKG
ncbi:MAG: DNA helicase RecQ [Saprospiraceae bacterium]|nr:DNA helicase RecQ [Saprospiraceae bacterium]